MQGGGVLEAVRRGYERLMEAVVIVLMVALSVVVTLGIVYRTSGAALVWYDEVASIGLAWLTYYGSALAALRGAHIGFPGIVNAMPPRLRLVVTLFGEACVFFFFIVLAYTGMEVLMILEGDTLVSLPSVPLQLTQSVIPVGAVLFIIAQLLRLPDVIKAALGGGFVDHELEEALPARDLPILDNSAPVAAAVTGIPVLQDPVRQGHMLQGGPRR
jgi:TRAP-type C4-dicarboxylate transport system permease small subunit